MRKPLYPSLYQINTRIWLTELSRALGRPATLDDIPDAEIDRVAGMGFDWIWLLSVWQTGPAAQRVAREAGGEVLTKCFLHLGARWDSLHGVGAPFSVRRGRSGFATGRIPYAFSYLHPV
jgi:hypothetical protein